MPYIPHTQKELEDMLAAIGARTLDDLFADIPPQMRVQDLKLPKGLDEGRVCEFFEELASKNNTDLISFLGAGFYAHQIPKAVDSLSGRSEFYTAYTPYQAECSQGTLQAIFEFQTAIARLFEMDVANASVYDGGSALFEACMMAIRSTKRKKIIIDEAFNPIWRSMLKTYVSGIDEEIITVPQKDGVSDMAALKDAIDGQSAAVIVQNPNFFGAIADYSDLFAAAHAKKTFGIISVNPIMQSVLKTPGEMGADVAIAEGQSLGMPLSFGGPYLGLMACRKQHVRQMPGRIVGQTEDEAGKTGYVLTLQAREQHIRRVKATSNICSNQALCALRALIYLSLLGPEGLRRLAEHNMALARYAMAKLTTIKGVAPLNNAPYGFEFTLRLPIPSEQAISALIDKGCVPGFNVGYFYPDMPNALLVATTELNTRGQIDALTELMGEIM